MTIVSVRQFVNFARNVVTLQMRKILLRSFGIKQFVESHAPVSLYDQYVITSFSNQINGGNPAAVVFGMRNENDMQRIAFENNLGATAFVDKTNGDDIFDIRWFTNTKELQLCGHGTLAAAHILYELGIVSSNNHIKFLSRHSGSFDAIRSKNGHIQLDFPSTPPFKIDLTHSEREVLQKAFNINENDMKFVGKTISDLFVDVEPDIFWNIPLHGLAYNTIALLDVRGVTITCLGGAHTKSSRTDLIQDDKNHHYDFVSRSFLPRIGLNEDHVTGSAHCALAPYWFDVLSQRSDNNNNNNSGIQDRKVLIGYQASPRGGKVTVGLSKDKSRVTLTGPCRTTMKCKLLI